MTSNSEFESALRAARTVDTPRKADEVIIATIRREAAKMSHHHTKALWSSARGGFSIAACLAAALCTVTMWRQADEVGEREALLDEEGKILLDIIGMSSAYDFYGVYYDESDNT